MSTTDQTAEATHVGVNLVAVSIDPRDNDMMKQTTIEFVKPTMVTVWRQLNEHKIQVAAGDQLAGTLYTDHTLENLDGDHHMPAGSYRVMSTGRCGKLIKLDDRELRNISDLK